MFRRRRAEVDPADETDGTDDAAGQTPDDAGSGGRPGGDPRSGGPWDADEVEVPEDDESRIDLGGLLVTPHERLDVQLQVDEPSGQVMAVVLAGERGAAEVRVFAAPRNGDIWDDSRRALAAEVAQVGGTATEREGPFGPELVVSVPVQLPDGQHAVQESVMVGVRGPRWLLRATLFGRPAAAYDPEGSVEQALRDMVVVRGSQPIPPGDALPLTMPPGAQLQGPGPDAV